MSNLTYKTSGVDIRKADAFVDAIKGMVGTNIKSSARAFGAPFDLAPFVKGCKQPVLVSSTDGVGTKLKVAIECGIHDTVGVDLVGMNVNDVICLGAKPLFFLDYIACGKVEPKVLKAVVSGIHKGLEEADCFLVGGETAEMPGMYSGQDYDLAGFCCGIADKKKIIDGSRIKPGDLVIGIESSGPHSNGYSLARKALGEQGVKKYARELLMPTRIYVRPILSLLRSLHPTPHTPHPIKGIAHITGGAFYNKAVKILPAGLGMVLDKSCWSVPKIFKIIQSSGGIAEREMYTVFNMGIGMMVVVDKTVAAKAATRLNRFYPARVIGKVVKSPTAMEII
jgi:phosphoribosylformylglycinamidine cyclo-ligase